MANDLNARLLDAFQSTEDEDGQLCFSQYFFKEWTEIEALYKLTMYNESLNKKEESAAETSQSEDDSEMEKESDDEEDEDLEEELEEELDEDQDKINQLGENLENMIITKQNLLYENPMREQNRYQRYFFYNSRVHAAEGWIGKPENMDDDTFDSSSDDETSSLSD